MKKRFLFTLLACLPVLFVSAQNKQIRKLDGTLLSVAETDRIITRLMEEAEVTGLNLGIINDNRITYVKSYGFRNKEKKEKIDTSTIFSAASFSKAVFAYLVLQLAQEGKIDLDKPIYQYLDKPLPDHIDYKDLAGDERWKLITARHCLSHTTGFPNWRFLNPNGNRKLEIFFIPGQRYAYSGEGLYLLQMVVEKATGRKLEDMMQEKIFRPMGMTRTSYLWQPAFENNYAIGYDGDGKPIELRKRYQSNAAGSMLTTIADYCRFTSAVMKGQGLLKEYWNQMISPQVRINSVKQFPSLRTDTTNDFKKIELSYGLGWGLLTSKYGKAFFKEGHDDGWEHYTINFPDRKTSIIIMTNSSNGESIFKELLEKVIGDTYTPWQWENYTPYRKVAPISPSVLGEYSGLYKLDGMQVKITLENGYLKLDAKEAGLSMVNLYAEKKDHFFIRVVDISIEFARNTEGRIDRMIVNDGVDKMEFKKTDN
jgi:CubicO group peptidase (beta-lactamase class C family)